MPNTIFLSDFGLTILYQGAKPISMTENTYMGLTLFIGLVLGGVAGKILFNSPSYGALVGGVLGFIIGFWLDQRKSDV